MTSFNIFNRRFVVDQCKKKHYVINCKFNCHPLTCYERVFLSNAKRKQMNSISINIRREVQIVFINAHCVMFHAEKYLLCLEHLLDLSSYAYKIHRPDLIRTSQMENICLWRVIYLLLTVSWVKLKIILSFF